MSTGNKISAPLAGRRVLIGGCSHLGAILADHLSEKGSDVTVIDSCTQAFGRLSSSFSGKQITGDLRDPQLLEQAGIEKCTLFIACTGKENVNVFCAQAAKLLYGAANVICRVKNEETAVLLEPWNIASVSPVLLSAREILEKMEGDRL